jgi:heme exporter protein C
MKGLLIGGAITLSLLLGFWPGGISKAKPAWWRWLAIVSMVLLCVLALGIPTGGEFAGVSTIAMSRGDTAVAPVRATVVEVDDNTATLRDRVGRTEKVVLTGSSVQTNELKPGEEVIVDVSFNRSEGTFHAVRLVSSNPIASLPLIPALEERARNLYFHVPTAWLAQLAWFVAFGYAVVYLRKRRPEDDIRASSAAALGALFCILATVTGAVWARFNWGVFWNWDPRQTSIFIVLVIYGAYFALRSAIDNDDQRARISSVYLVLLMVPVLFFLFVLPRLVEGLHPGSAGDVNTGPVLSADADALDPIKQWIFALSWFSFTLLFFWMLNLSVRTRLYELRRRRRELGMWEDNGADRVDSSTAMESQVVRLK